MDDKIVEIPIAKIKSPSKTAQLKNGSGFSLAEIKQAGKNVQILKKLKIKIDYFRKSVYESNVDLLKDLKAPVPKGKKRDPFVKKEKTSKKKFKGVKEEKPKAKEVKTETAKKAPKKKAATKKKPAAKKKAETKKVEKLTVESVEKIEPKPKEEIEGAIALTQLSGLGMTTAKKFENLGVNSVQELLEENAEELSKLIKGCSVVKIETWQKQGKALLEGK